MHPPPPPVGRRSGVGYDRANPPAGHRSGVGYDRAHPPHPLLNTFKVFNRGYITDKRLRTTGLVDNSHSIQRLDLQIAFESHHYKPRIGEGCSTGWVDEPLVNKEQ